MGFEPFLEVRFGPGLIQPVSRIRSRVASLLGDRLIVRADLLEKGITGPGLRD